MQDIMMGNGIKEGRVTIEMPQEYIYTTRDIYALPDGERAELIDGCIYYIAPPSRKHQDISFSISRIIADYIDCKGGPCKVYPAPFAVFLNKDDTNYVEPDISVICDKSKLDANGCNGAPDWIVEVVSPSSRNMDYSVKLFKYRAAGVREYWIVDPDKDRVTVWYFEKDSTEEFTFMNCITANIYDDLTVDFAKLNI